MKRTCPVCFLQFDAHPNATYCTITCANRAAYHRRQERRFLKATAPSSPYQFILEDITPELLSQIYTDVQIHVYDRDIRINGAIPPNVPQPSDVILLPAGDHHLIYHALRAV